MVNPFCFDLRRHDALVGTFRDNAAKLYVGFFASHLRFPLCYPLWVFVLGGVRCGSVMVTFLLVRLDAPSCSLIVLNSTANCVWF